MGLTGSLFHFFSELEAITLFLSEAARAFFRVGLSKSCLREVWVQMYNVGWRSLSTTVVTGAFVGAILAVQIQLELVDFGAEGYLGGLTTSVTLRNLGPVLIAFILSGKVGAYTSAELGTMRVTDQIDAIRCLGVDPIEYLILPRLLAVTVSSFLLLVIGLFLTVLGGLWMANGLGVNSLQYVQQISRFVTGASLWMAATKSLVFGFLIALLSCYQGYTASGGALGVGQTVRRTAVGCLVLILVADNAIAAFFRWVLQWGVL